MSSASNFPKEMPRPLLVPDIARLVQQTMPEVSERMVLEMLRDPEAPEVPHFGLAGNARLFDEMMVRAKLPKMLAWFADTGPRMMRRRAATMQADAERTERQRSATKPVWTDPVADARRARNQVPPGFMRGGSMEPERKPKPKSNIGRPQGGY